MIHVLNHKHPNRFEKPVMFYNIDRGTPIGNPFPLNGDRELCIQKYTKYFYAERAKPGYTAFNNYLNEILMAARKVDVGLLCHCAPLACHGDVIADWLRRELTKNDQNGG